MLEEGDVIAMKRSHSSNDANIATQLGRIDYMCSLWNCSQTLLPICAERQRAQSCAMLVPRWESLSTNSLLHISVCSINPICVGTGVTVAVLYLTVTD